MKNYGEEAHTTILEQFLMVSETLPYVVPYNPVLRLIIIFFVLTNVD